MKTGKWNPAKENRSG